MPDVSSHDVVQEGLINVLPSIPVGGRGGEGSGGEGMGGEGNSGSGGSQDSLCLVKLVVG